jgi:hypothetical protein
MTVTNAQMMNTDPPNPKVRKLKPKTKLYRNVDKPNPHKPNPNPSSHPTPQTKVNKPIRKTITTTHMKTHPKDNTCKIKPTNVDKSQAPINNGIKRTLRLNCLRDSETQHGHGRAANNIKTTT